MTVNICHECGENILDCWCIDAFPDNEGNREGERVDLSDLIDYDLTNVIPWMKFDETKEEGL